MDFTNTYSTSLPTANAVFDGKVHGVVVHAKKCISPVTSENNLSKLLDDFLSKKCSIFGDLDV